MNASVAIDMPAAKNASMVSQSAAGATTHPMNDDNVRHHIRRALGVRTPSTTSTSTSSSDAGSTHTESTFPVIRTASVERFRPSKFGAIVTARVGETVTVTACRTVDEVISHLEELSLSIARDGKKGQHRRHDELNNDARVKSFIEVAQDNPNVFVWIDLHGMPPAVGTPDSSTLDMLWRYVGLHPSHRLDLNQRQPQHIKQSWPASLGNDSFNSSSSSDTSSSASSVPTLLVGDTYDEDSSMLQSPDTVRVYPVQPRADHVGPVPGCYTGMELAGLVEEVPLRCNGEAHPFLRAAQRSLSREGTREGIHTDLDEECVIRHATKDADETTPYLAEAVVLVPTSSEGQRTAKPEEELQRRTLSQFISALHVMSFSNGCVTWCPRSSYGVFDRQDYFGSCTSVKDWCRLQDAVDASLREGVIMTTGRFVSLLLSTVCYAYLPDTTQVLNEVDAIDAMLPLIVPDEESDQADALRRVLLLRRKLAVHRRLLTQKVRLLDDLQKPVMRTVAAFMRDVYELEDNNNKSRQLQQQGGASVSAAATMRHEIGRTLSQLDGARTVLGNTTIIYTSTVTFRNCNTSTTTDLYMLMLQYMLMVVLPLSVLASHWGMNCYVPWQGAEDNTTPFWVLVAIMLGLALMTLVYPIWAYNTGRMELVM